MAPPKRNMQELYATPEDWNTHQETITQLYLHDKLSLQEVMDHMALNHFFFATVKMYRTRIRKWGIDKNNKAAEVAHMVRLKKHRDVLGKKSCFYIRNRPVDWYVVRLEGTILDPPLTNYRDDIERYLARTPDFWGKQNCTSIDLGISNPDITCKTPPPSPPRTPPSVPHSLDAARDLRVHEEILRFFRDYTQGSFEQGVWHLSPTHKRYVGRGGAEANARLNVWYDKVRNVSDWPGRDADAVCLVNYLLDDLPQFLRDQDFTVFPALMRCCYYLSARRPELGKAVVHFVARLCAIILGAKHPMSLAWSRITSLDIAEYLLVLQGIAKIRLDQLSARHPGTSLQDNNIINALREYLLVLRLQGAAAASEIDRVTSLALTQLSDPTAPLTTAQYRLLLGTATSYITCGRFPEAEALLSRVGAQLTCFHCHLTSRPPKPSTTSSKHTPRSSAQRAEQPATADILLALIDFPWALAGERGKRVSFGGEV
ncbi:hypothetical protein N0V88_007070 [Collariella sp. IMI 366227]|nr:hypothetical protein N0V88_007070 [Collariella sp. IMI 366227]